MFVTRFAATTIYLSLDYKGLQPGIGPNKKINLLVVVAPFGRRNSAPHAKI